MRDNGHERDELPYSSMSVLPVTTKAADTNTDSFAHSPFPLCQIVAQMLRTGCRTPFLSAVVEVLKEFLRCQTFDGVTGHRACLGDIPVLPLPFPFPAAY